MHASNPETVYSAGSGDWTQARLITVSGSARTVPMSHRDKLKFYFALRTFTLLIGKLLQGVWEAALFVDTVHTNCIGRLSRLSGLVAFRRPTMFAYLLSYLLWESLSFRQRRRCSNDKQFSVVSVIWPVYQWRYSFLAPGEDELIKHLADYTEFIASRVKCVRV